MLCVHICLTKNYHEPNNIRLGEITRNNRQTNNIIMIQQKKQRVRFAPKEQETVICPDSSKDMSEMEHVWSSRADLARFRETAYLDAKSILSCSNNSSSSIEELTNDLSFYECLGNSYKGFCKSSVQALTQEECMMGQYRDTTTRGLENLLIKKERLKYRKIARSAVLEIQRRMSNGSDEKERSLQIAKIAVKFSRWAREIAYRRGQRDAAIVNVQNQYLTNNACSAKQSHFLYRARIERKVTKRRKHYHDNIIVEVQ